ncbi:MAG TPA: NAD(P)/FAD-dependent oxidoreductase [Chitinophaga sp.]|uniref:NAD(P)/FAD-dependent oxidoreductase n=1 Tax=Chitinophaga sp. TaxID=1869181 RepID=UPI002BE9DA9B|nr:NAD(P)/FAD-dependent oxidoreductase [Chitinophaga sp.]HVI44019.1 NAD(P)/FAD-dependent oxidoreductase [Chitinophaga sp.]
MLSASDIVIVGGGLAGLTSAIHLSRSGLRVTLIEKHQFPKHKVCGEYISNEVLPYLQWLGADPAVLHPAALTRVEVSAVNGQVLSSPLPLGGFGVSRYTLDYFLMTKAATAGVTCLTDTVTDIFYEDEQFSVHTGNHGVLTSRIVLGAYGKRAALDQRLAREFARNRSPWLAVKGHYEGAFPEGLVALHNFHGGYCGVSRIEDNKLNICYLVNYETFRRYKNIETYQEEVLYQNVHLKRIFENSRLLFEAPLTISQVSFEEKTKVTDHILMMGDAAGLIHPLCGNGMAMAVHSGKIAAEGVLRFFNADGYTRAQLENDYIKAWNRQFRTRMQAGRLLAGLFLKDRLSALLVQGLAAVPGVLPMIIRQTHGKPINV